MSVIMTCGQRKAEFSAESLGHPGKMSESPDYLTH